MRPDHDQSILPLGRTLEARDNKTKVDSEHGAAQETEVILWSVPVELKKLVDVLSKRLCR